MSTGLNTLGFIKSNSLSYTEIQNDLNNFVNALSEDEKLGFKTLFEGNSSQILIEMIAAKSSDELYHIITSRSENLMQYLNRLDSAIAIAQNDNYSVFRGSNIKLEITIMPSKTVILPKMSIIAVAEDYDVITTETLHLISGVETTFTAYLGKAKEQTLIANSNELLVFRFTNSNISEQIALYVDGTSENNEVPTSKYAIDLINDTYFCVTNAYSGVDVLYLNKRENFTHKYQNGSVLTLKYIEYENIQSASLDVESDYGEIRNVKQISKTLEPETIASIRQNSALYAETQNRIVARDDFQKVMKYTYPILEDATSRDFSNAIVEVTYVKKDGELLTDSEYTTMYNDLSKRRGFGIPMCILSSPNVLLNFNIIVALQLNYSSGIDVQKYVREVLRRHELKLAHMIDFASIEHDLENYDFIKIARVRLNAIEYTPDATVVEGTTFSPSIEDGHVYTVRNILFLTGASEPVWSTTVGDTIQDGDILWSCESKSHTAQLAWTASTSIHLGDVRWPTDTEATTQYKCIGFTKKTGSVEPSWNTVLNDTTIDSQIQWKTVAKDVSADTWEASTIIEKGTIVNSTEDLPVSFQAINYATVTSSIEPTWSYENKRFVDGSIEYEAISSSYNPNNVNAFTLQLDWNQYCVFKETIEVV